ncbi:MAG: hypothetical protein KDC47_10855 [Flavobacteriaceae bacterium]|nr:hypothetical protein [Flavobacteriaceae bacterium]
MVGAVKDIGVASQSIPSLTSVGGVYSNRIPQKTEYINNVAEVCFKDGQTQYDPNNDNSINSGDCQPGDVGFVIERNESEAKKWHQAKAQCTAKGMRLPELFEWMLACDNASTLGMNNMTGNWEWSSNNSHVTYAGTGKEVTYGLVVPVSGEKICDDGGFGWVTGNRSKGKESYFRCVK